MCRWGLWAPCRREHARGLATLAGQPDIPVACGPEIPLVGNYAFPDEWRDGVDALLGLDLPDSPSQEPAGSAIDLLKSALDSSEVDATLLTLGPLTNVAMALQDTPSLAERIDTIYIMGGAVEVSGNVGPSIGIDNEFAEWNVYADPLAAKVVLESGANIALIPLDATNDAPVTSDFADELGTNTDASAADFANRGLTQMRPPRS